MAIPLGSPRLNLYLHWSQKKPSDRNSVGKKIRVKFTAEGKHPHPSLIAGNGEVEDAHKKEVKISECTAHSVSCKARL